MMTGDRTLMHGDIELTLEDMPCIAGTNEEPYYVAVALDAQGRDYEITWEIIEGCENEEDESQCCDWDDYEVNPLFGH